jgi:hypothetical protein
MAAIDYIDTVQGVYLAYYGRFADQAGLTYWTSALNTNGGNLNSIIQAFGTSAEATALYPTTLTTAAKINMVYQTLFGRDADTAGSTYYQGLISSGQATLVDIAKRVLDGATAQDSMMINNKIVVADQLSTTVGAQATYTGAAVITAARTLMSGVTSDATTKTTALNNAATTINTAAGAAAPAAAAAVDTTPPVVSGVDYGSATTIKLTSNEAGAAGLWLNGTNVNMSTNPTGTVSLAAGAASTALTVAASGGSTSGVSYDLRVSDAAGNITVSPTKVIVGTAGADTVVGTTGNDIFFGFATADTFTTTGGNDIIADLGSGGAADVVVVSAGSTATAYTAGSWTATAATTVSATGTLNVYAAGNTVSLANIAVTAGGTVNLSNLSSSTAVTLTGDADGATTIRAGSGGDTIVGGSAADTIFGGAGNDTINGGGGADIINAGAGNDMISGLQAAINAATINGGDGTDTLTILDNGLTVSDSTFQNVTNVEKLALTGTGALSFTVGGYANSNVAGANAGVLDVTAASLTNGATIDASGLSGTNSLKLSLTDTDGGSNGAIAITTSNGGADNITISGNSGSGNLTISGGSNTKGITVDISGATTTGTISVTGGSGADTIKLMGLVASVTGGAGADTITLSAADGKAQTIIENTAGASTTTAYDVVSNFQMVATNGDLLKFASTTLLSGTNLGTGWTITNGVAAKSGASVADFTAAAAAAVNAGVVAFSDGTNMWVAYADGTAGTTTSDQLVELVGITATAVSTTVALNTIGIV